MGEESPDRADTLDRAREAFGRRAWGEAHTLLLAARRVAPLEPADTERLARVAHLVGRDVESLEHLAEAHQEYLRRGEVEGAARSAFWLGHVLVFQGEPARGGGWLARARRLLDEAGLDGALRGYLLLPEGFRRVMEGDAAEAYDTFGRALAIGERCGDAALVTLARQGQGRVLVRAGRVAEGMALLDEVMVAVTADELPADIVGTIYCSVLDACHEICDLRRAREWTEALRAWCASQPDLVAHRGVCLVRHAELLQLHGAWPDALDEAARACGAGEPGTAPLREDAAGAAFYQCGELHRLRGEFARAEAAYREASRRGRDPQPGLALLRLAQGEREAAAAAIERAVDEARTLQTRARVLGASVEILLAAGQVAPAREAADALATIAAGSQTPFLRALAAHAAGAVLLAEGAPRAAAAALRDATACWRELDAPYEGARVAVLLARALGEGALGDVDAARMERDAARQVFRRLGAAPDLERLDEEDGRAVSTARPLTARELEVLRLLATGRTNRAIAGALAISEKTVARHVANIFTKLALSSRAAATAYAYQHALV